MNLDHMCAVARGNIKHSVEKAAARALDEHRRLFPGAPRDSLDHAVGYGPGGHLDQRSQVCFGHIVGQGGGGASSVWVDLGAFGSSTTGPGSVFVGSAGDALNLGMLGMQNQWIDNRFGFTPSSPP